MKPEKTSPKSRLNNYAYYSSIAIQMGVIIFLGIWGGRKIDALLGLPDPVFTLILSFISVPIAIYIAIKDFIRKK